MIYTCTKTFKIYDFTFIENEKYCIREYGKLSNIFYAGLPIQPISNLSSSLFNMSVLYVLDIKYREFFITEKQLRKIKLQELNEKTNRKPY